MVYGFSFYFSHCDCEFMGGCCLNMSHMIAIDEVMELVKVTKIVRRSVFLLLIQSCQILGEDQGVRYLVKVF